MHYALLYRTINILPNAIPILLYTPSPVHDTLLTTQFSLIRSPLFILQFSHSSLLHNLNVVGGHTFGDTTTFNFSPSVALIFLDENETLSLTHAPLLI